MSAMHTTQTRKTGLHTPADHSTGMTSRADEALKTIKGFDARCNNKGFNLTEKDIDRITSAIQVVGEHGNRSTIQSLTNSPVIKACLSLKKEDRPGSEYGLSKIAGALTEIFAGLQPKEAVRGLKLIVERGSGHYCRLEAAKVASKFGSEALKIVPSLRKLIEKAVSSEPSEPYLYRKTTAGKEVSDRMAEGRMIADVHRSAERLIKKIEKSA